MPLNFVAKAAINIGLAAANMALTASRKIEGPRLDNLKFTSGDYGSPLHMVWGLRRLEVPIFWAEDLREVKRRRKTKGGKFNEYSYFGTWAVAIAGHEISAVRRIWFDTHLVYDMTGAGPVTPFDFGGTGNIDDFIAIYLGTETQLPDPRMEATVEAEFGEGSCPAYRGTAYICFKDIPLEKLGNRIPQVSVEVASGTVYPFDSIAFSSSPSLLAFSADYSTLLVSNYLGDYWGVDTAALATMVTGDITQSTEDTSEGWAFLSDGTILFCSPVGDIYSVSFGSGAATLVLDSGAIFGTVTSVVDDNGDDHWFTRLGTTYVYNGVEYDSADTIGFSTNFEMIFKDCDGSIWLVGRAGTTAVFYRVSGIGDGPAIITATGLSAGTDYAYAFHYTSVTQDHFVLAWNGIVYAIDRETGTVLDSLTVASVAGLTYNAFRAIKPGAGTFFCAYQEIDSATLTQVRQLAHSSWHGGVATNLTTIYDPINHALIVKSGSTLFWDYLDRVGTDGVPLSTIMGDVADWVAVEDYDFSALDQTIPGWSTTRGQASNMLEPLLDAYDSDIRPHDFTIHGIKRTGTSGGTLLTPVFVAENPRYNIKVRASAELPIAVMVNFADTTADQQPNAMRSARPLAATDARSEKALDLTTLALSPDTARQLGDRHFRRIWGERREVSLSLTAQQLKLEPGDLRTLTLDDEAMTARLVKLTVKANDVLATEWKEDFASLALTDSAAGAPFDGRNDQAVTVPVLSKGWALDIPLLNDADARTPPAIYVLAAPYATGTWPGAVLYQAVDGEYTEELAAITSSSPSAWGYVSQAFAYTNPNIWDRGTSLTVTLQYGALSGATEAAIDTNPMLNLAAIGLDGRWEIVQFSTATLVSGSTYTVSGFKRGRRGTEWAAELHVASDEFVLLNYAEDVAMGLSEVGTAVSFKTITQGRTSAFPYGYTYSGATLKPYAPCQLKGVRNFGTNDWVLTWNRRTRIGGSWRSGLTIPLSEASEEYEVEIMNGASVVRTVTGLSSPTYTYSSANQVTDFGSNQAAITFRVYQISAAVDRGFMADATV